MSQILVNKSDKSDHPHQREPWCFVEVVNKVGAEAYRFPRVFGDEFGDEFGDSLNFVSKLVTHLVMISVNHCIW